MALFIVLLGGGCALMKAPSSPRIRYFTPEVIPAPPQDPAGEAAGAHALRLRLTRVNAASYIEDRIAYRDAGAEVGYYGSLRWADPPEAYLRRALATAFFEERQVREIVGGEGPSLEIELVAFEELRAPRHAARIVITWRLRDKRTVIVQKTVSVEQPIEVGQDPEQLGNEIAGAMARALSDAVGGVVGDVIAALAVDRPDNEDVAAAP